MDHAAWNELAVRSMLATWREFARATGSGCIDREGIFAIVNSAARERSVFNSCGYTDAAALLAAREEIAAIYAEAGCAWTVWVPEADREVARELEAASHVLDAEPRAMGLELAGYPQPDLSDLDWTDHGGVEACCLINDHAYGYPEGTWVRGIGDGVESLRIYIANLGGNPAATVATLRHAGDCEVWSVATEPEARGRGLCTALMRRALWDAGRAGCETSTLQATKLGRPVYEQVGFEDFGALQMWECRPPELAGSARGAASA